MASLSPRIAQICGGAAVLLGLFTVGEYLFGWDAGQSQGGVTLSLGVAVYPQHGRSIEVVRRAADVALYQAKQDGRNRVVVAKNTE